MSTQLDLYPLPYTAPHPPEGLYRGVDKVSIYSGTTTFNARIDVRDVFLGRRRCVICGYAIPSVLQHCHIVGREDVGPWELLKHLGWAPEHIKKTPDHEPRNGLLMCANHRGAFDALTFFIRFQPAVESRFHCLACRLLTATRPESISS